MLAQWLRHASEPKDAGLILAMVAAFLMKMKGENVRVFEISAHAKDPQVV